MEIDPLFIKKIETVRKRFIKDGFKYSGIVSFSTYNGDYKGLQLNNKALVVEYDGIQLAIKYISPKYEKPTDKNSRIPDYRNVLYWNPLVNTNDKGEAILEFYASDDISEYEIHVEGISNDGRTACGRAMIRVVNDPE